MHRNGSSGSSLEGLSDGRMIDRPSIQCQMQRWSPFSSSNRYAEQGFGNWTKFGLKEKWLGRGLITARLTMQADSKARL
jgi:hypothetical protein